MTLYVGIDIHHKSHIAALIPEDLFFIKSGRKQPPWKSAPTIKVTNTRSSYEALVAAIQEHQVEQVYIGLEPTGHHYSKPLAWHLQSAGYHVYFVDNAASRDLRARFFRISAKNDKIDARCLAACLYFHFQHGETLGLHLAELELETLAASINQLNNARHNVVKDITRCKNRLRQLLHGNCPEIEEQLFAAWLTVATSHPTAQDLAIAALDDLANSGIAKTKATRLIDLAKHTIGCPIADKETIQCLALHYEDLVDLRLKLELRLKARVRTHPYWPILNTFPSLQELTAAAIIGAIANIQAYPTKKKFRKALGHYVQTETTGQSKKRGKAGHVGNRRAKGAITMLALRHARHSPYHARRIAQGLDHNRAALSGKICEILWSMLYHTRPYDPGYNNNRKETNREDQDS